VPGSLTSQSIAAYVKSVEIGEAGNLFFVPECYARWGNIDLPCHLEESPVNAGHPNSLDSSRTLPHFRHPDGIRGVHSHCRYS
jgi:hypothetical protein